MISYLDAAQLGAAAKLGAVQDPAAMLGVTAEAVAVALLARAKGVAFVVILGTDVQNDGVNSDGVRFAVGHIRQPISLTLRRQRLSGRSAAKLI